MPPNIFNKFMTGKQRKDAKLVKNVTAQVKNFMPLVDRVESAEEEEKRETGDVLLELTRVNKVLAVYYEERRKVEDSIAGIGGKLTKAAAVQARRNKAAREEALLLTDEVLEPSATRKHKGRMDPNSALRWCLAYCTGERVYPCWSGAGNMVMKPYVGERVNRGKRSLNWTRVITAASKINRFSAQRTVSEQYEQLLKEFQAAAGKATRLDAIIKDAKDYEHDFMSSFCRGLMGTTTLNRVRHKADLFVEHLQNEMSAEQQYQQT